MRHLPQVRQRRSRTDERVGREAVDDGGERTALALPALRVVGLGACAEHADCGRVGTERIGIRDVG